MGLGAGPRFGMSAVLALLVAGASCRHPSVQGGPSGSGGGTGNSGAGGAAAGAGGSNADGGPGDAGPWRGPTPPTTGHNFPFPQNRESAGCVYPQGYLNEKVQAAYTQWKTDTVVVDVDSGGFRVKRPHEPTLDVDSTVSEGIGYGMLIAVYMDDQPLFDGLWKYEQRHVQTDGLMNWYILANGQIGTNPDGRGAATDADEDMAFALLMADRQWGGSGTLGRTYLQYATDLVTAIWNNEIIGSKLAGAGDGFPKDFNHINISYFAPAYYRVFKSVNVPNADWDAVINTAYDTIDIALNNDPAQQANGLVPAWCVANGTPPSGVCAPTGPVGNYQYDSCRTPFRIALDWCWFGVEPRAKAYLAKTSAFFSAKGATNIVDGYDLNGTEHPQYAAAGTQSAAFVGPAGVGAMSDSASAGFVTAAYEDVAKLDLLIGGTYYEDSWTLMSLLMMTGNFLNYTAY
jgi:endo-1,4-beta-D-glucanase Y